MTFFLITFPGSEAPQRRCDGALRCWPHWEGNMFRGKQYGSSGAAQGGTSPVAIWGRLMTRRLGAWRYKYLEKKICFSKIWKRSTSPARNDRVRERGAWVRVRVRVCVSVNSYTGWTVILWNLFFSPQFATVPQMFSHTHPICAVCGCGGVTLQTCLNDLL